jgi:hypothetical protein
MLMHVLAVALAAAQAAATTTAPQAQIQQPQAATIAAQPNQAVILGSAGDNILRAGTEVPLRLEETLSSNDKTIREGHRFRLTVASDVMLGTQVVIPAGTPATGEVVDLRRKGMWGKSGRIMARVLNARVGDRLIRLTGSFDDRGTTGTAGVVGAAVFVPIAGFFLTGTSAQMPAGSGVKAFLDEDLVIAR